MSASKRLKPKVWRGHSGEGDTHQWCLTGGRMPAERWGPGVWHLALCEDLDCRAEALIPEALIVGLLDGAS